MKLAHACLLLVSLSCSRPNDAADSGSQPNRPRYGAVMSEVGKRFELAGRAVSANRFELAAFEVGELRELFEGDLPRAELPKEGPSAILPGLADAFVKTRLPDLEKASVSRDRAAFANAFRAASASCNGCHQASGHGFVVVPPEVGSTVPDLSPVP
jgi:hypothetical protein